MTAGPEADQVAAARRGDEAAFEALVAAYRNPLHAYCYRMLGSVHDADDALQETLLAAWRGLPGFEGRSSLRSWLYRIATHACLRLAATRRRRALAPGYGPARTDVNDLGDLVTEPIWLEPYPETGADPAAGGDSDPAARYAERENVELAFVAALQYLPPVQRAVLILHDVLQFSAPEVAQALDRSVASVNSALQRARKAAGRQAGLSRQQAELAALGDQGQRELVGAFVAAWEQADVAALVALLADDVRFSMPPLPAWLDGRADVARFFAQRIWTTSWRLVPVRANGQLAFACYHGQLASACHQGQTRDQAEDRADAPLRLSALNVLTLRAGDVAELTGFLDPAVHRRFGLPQEFSRTRDEVSGLRVSLRVSGVCRLTRRSHQMPSHHVGTREQWRQARLELLAAEKELTRRNDELTRQRQQLPWVPVETGYRFSAADGGEVSLPDLFGHRSQLLIYHFMFGPDWAAGCPMCSSLADGFDGIRVHLEHHDVALAAVSRAPAEKLAAYRKRMGWSFPWVSSSGTSFNVDFGVSYTAESVAGGAEHNFAPLPAALLDPRHLPAEAQGLSAFALEDGVVYHTYSAYARGCEPLWGMWQWLDRAPAGRNEHGMSWFHRHDEYSPPAAGVNR